MRSFAILLSLLLGIYGKVLAQNPDKGSPLQIGIGLSANAYSGDLNYQERIPLRAYPGINFSLQFDNKKRLGFQVNSGFARFTEQKDNFSLPGQGEFQPNIFVRTNFFYVDLRLRHFFYHRRKVRPFLAAGVGFISFNPEDEEGDFLSENIFTRLPEEESYLTLVAQVPIQAGVQIRVKPTLSINLSTTYRFTATDYLDNIGLFGQKSGNDALFSAQAELVFTLLGKDPEKKPNQQNNTPEQMPLVRETYDYLMDWEKDGESKNLGELCVEPVRYSKRR